jgi:hypothetical protein
MDSFIPRRPKPNRSAKSKSKNKGKGRQGPGRGRRTGNEPQGELVTFSAKQTLQTVVRRFRSDNTVSSTAAGLIAPFAISASAVTSDPDWANFSQEFQQYRVKKVGTRFFPATTNATATTGPFQSGVKVAPWRNNAITTLSGINQAPEMIKFSTLEEKEVQIRATGPNSRLWTPVGTALVADRNYGFSGCSVGSNLAVSSIIYNLIIEYDVEFCIPV